MRLRYSTLRFIAALSCGACAMIACWCIMWAITEKPIQDVIFVSLFVYFVVGGAIGWMTEPKRKPAPKPIEKPAKLRIRNIKEGCWDVYDK